MAIGLGTLACDHTEPFSYTPPAALGPFSSGVPRQLTFNPGDDRFPSLQGDMVVYSRRLAERFDRDWCVGVLPDTGGQLVHELCAPGPSDNYVDAYRYPALSPDTASVIFWKERGRTSNTVPAERGFVRVNWVRPDSLIPVLDAPYLLSDGTRGNAVRQVTWPTPTTLRFIAGLESVDLFTTDTVFTPYGVAELDLASGTVAILPGTVGAATYANSSDGGVWFSLGDGAVIHMASGAAGADTVATFPSPIVELSNANGVPVAVIIVVQPPGRPTTALGYVKAGETAFHSLWVGLPPLGVAASATSPVIIAPISHKAPSDPGGSLWMVIK